MTKFEELLLKTGNKELISAFVAEYKNILGSTFLKAAEVATTLGTFDKIPTEMDDVDAFAFIREKTPQDWWPRFFGVFSRHHVEKVGDIRKLTAEDFIKFNDVGNIMLAELKYALGIK